jgi:hypothetical protein
MKKALKWEKQDVMSLNMKLLHISGIVAPTEVKASSFRMTLYRLYFVCCYAIYFPVLSGQILALYHFWGDIDVTTNSIFNLLGALMSFTEATYARFNAREIAKLFETFQNQVMPKMLTVGLKERQNVIFDSAAKKARLITLIIMVTLDVMVVSWIPAPFIKHLMEERSNTTEYKTEHEKKWLNFCYIIWFPVDITMSPYFEIMYVTQCIVFITATTYLKAVETTVSSMMVHIAAQFEILYTALEDIDAIVFPSQEEVEYIGGECFGGSTNTSLEDDFKRTGLGAPVRQRVQKRKAITNADIMDMKDYGTKKGRPELEAYLAKFVEYHQTVIE